MPVTTSIVARLDGGGRSIGKVAVDLAIAVVHGTDEAAWATLLLVLSALAVGVVSWLVGIRAVAVARAGDISGILLRPATVAVAEFLLPALSATALLLATIEVLLATALGLKLLWLRRALHGRNLSRLLGTLGVLIEALLRTRGVHALVLALAPTPSAAFGLAHSVRDRLAVVLYVAILWSGRRWGTLVRLHLGHILF